MDEHFRYKPFSVGERIKSFVYAFKGLRTLFVFEHNSRIHLFAAAFTVLLGFILDISGIEWIAVCFSIALVLGFEIINTAIEHLCDLISKEKSETIRRIKDLSAAAVLVSAIFALTVGIIIFIPKIIAEC